jgi:hypothetical protein
MKTKTARDTYAAITQSGFSQLPWCGQVVAHNGEKAGQDEESQGQWLVSVEILNPDADMPPYTTGTLSHDLVMHAARQVLDKPPVFATASLMRACRHLLSEADNVDLSAAAADALAQVAVLGDIVYAEEPGST